MGRGDIKTKKGKIFAGSFGKARPAKAAKKVVAETKKVKVASSVSKTKTVTKQVSKPVEEKPVVVKTTTKNDKKVIIEAKPLPVIINPDKLKPVKTILISQPIIGLSCNK